MKKINLIGLLMVCFTICSCNNQTSNTVDSSRKQIYVGLYNGGWGEDWFDEVVKRFESKYKEYQVIKVPKKDDYQYSALSNTINTASDVNDLYITECAYDAYRMNNHLLDITDCVTKDMADLNEPGQTIESKMEDEYRDFYKTSDNKYYAVPFGSSVWALNYDYDLFEEESLFISSYNKEDGTITWTDGKEGSPKKQAGRDGVLDTYDDGTPVTIYEFQRLLNKMRQKNITPFIWSNVSGYAMNMLLSLWADSEGKDNFNIISELSGTFTGYDNKEHTITTNNGYDINYMKGKKNALTFANEIISNKANYFTGSGSTEEGFTVAQQDYVLSKKQGKRIAFIIEGGHWYNEAKPFIDDSNNKYYAKDYPNGRRFSVMPFPSFTDDVSTTATYLESSHQFACFINRKSKEPEGAKLFIRYLCSDEMLKLTTSMNGLHRNYKYTLSENELAKLPFYYQRINELQQSKNVDIVSTRFKNKFWSLNVGMVPMYWVYEGSYINNNGKTASLGNPFDDLKNGIDKGLTVEKYLEGTKEARKTKFESYGA